MSAKLVKKNRFLPLIDFPFHFFIVFCTKTEGLVVLLQRNNEACMMKTKPIAIMLLTTLMAGCTEDVERQAQPYLERAEQAYTTKQYSLAKLQLDSIKLLYPKAFETRKRAQQLQVRVELDEAVAGKQYTDSLLTDTRARLSPLTAQLQLDKDARYQDVGHYYSGRHRAEQQVGRSYLRPQVSEQGECSIVAFYRGKAVGAHTLRLTAPDGTFMELRAQAEPYLTTDALGRTERTDYAVPADAGIASFVAQCQSLPRVTLMGQSGNASLPFGKHEAKALEQVCELASLLRLINELERQSDELTRRIEFFSNIHRQQAAAQ